MKKEFLILYLSMLVAGLTMILPGSTMPSLMEHFSLAEFKAGMIGSSFFSGGLIGILATSVFMSKMGARKTLILCNALTALVLFLMPAVRGYYFLIFLYFIVGIFFGVLVTLPGVVVNALEGESSASSMNAVYGFFALGVVIEPLVAGWLLERRFAWWIPYLLPAMVATLGAHLAWRTSSFREPKLQQQLSFKIIKEVWKSHPAILVVGVGGTLLYVASEVTLNLWIPAFLKSAFPTKLGISGANVVLTLFWMGLTAGRWLGAGVLKRIDPAVFLIILSLLGGVTVAIAPQMENYLLAGAGLALAGLWYSAMYPTLTSYTGRLEAHQAGAVFSLMAGGGQVGAMLFPAFVGGLAQGGNFALGMSLASVPLFLLVIFIIFFRVRGKI